MAERSGFRGRHASRFRRDRTTLSVLDLSPNAEGSDAGRSLHNSLDLARHVEALGYRRYWMAEHHNLPGSQARRRPFPEPCRPILVGEHRLVLA